MPKRRRSTSLLSAMQALRTQIQKRSEQQQTQTTQWTFHIFEQLLCFQVRSSFKGHSPCRCHLIHKCAGSCDVWPMKKSSGHIKTTNQEIHLQRKSRPMKSRPTKPRPTKLRPRQVRPRPQKSRQSRPRPQKLRPRPRPK